MWPRPTRICRVWPLVLLVLLFAGILLIYIKSAQTDDRRYDAARDFVHLQ